jgi:hypothetical protein
MVKWAIKRKIKYERLRGEVNEELDHRIRK